MSDLYPEPSHLSAFVMPGLERSRGLLACWEALRAADCVFTGDVLIARDGAPFHDVSELDREVIRYSGAPGDLLADHDPLRIQFRHRSLGGVALGLSPAAELGEPHPLEVAIHAGPLSLPVELWSREDRRTAKRLLGWIERLLLAVSEPTEALYGAIGIEAAFPSRAALKAAMRRSPLRPTTWFWRSRLSEKAARDEEQLLASLEPATVKRTPQGTLFEAWRPGPDAVVDENGIDLVVGFLDRTFGTST